MSNFQPVIFNCEMWDSDSALKKLIENKRLEWRYWWKMSPNPDRNKQSREVMFSEKINKDAHASSNSAPGKLRHLQKHLHLDNKSFTQRKFYIIDSTRQKRYMPFFISCSMPHWHICGSSSYKHNLQCIIKTFKAQRKTFDKKSAGIKIKIYIHIEDEAIKIFYALLIL